MANYSFKTTGLPEPVDGLIEGHNFTQASPHTAIYSVYSGLTFKNCNLINCDVPSDSILISCNRGHMSFCTNDKMNKFMAERGYLTPCVENCEHLKETDSVVIDGVIVEPGNKTYENEVVP